MRQLGDVIPLPAVVRPDPAGDFPIMSDVAVSADPAAADLAEHLAGLLRRATGWPVPVAEGGSIRVELARPREEESDKSPESYRLDIAADGMTLRAPARAGLFAGVQTIRQLLPEDPASAAIRELNEGPAGADRYSI